jgi:membrane associated rhomboid family serine protease
MPTAVRRSRSYVFFGNRFPAVVVWLAGFVLIGSCLLALDFRVGNQLARFLVLLPEAVLHGQVWRLATWSFLEFEGLGLIFGVLALLIFGRDLADAWGPRRYLVICVTLAAVTGVLTTSIALLVSSVRGVGYGTVWPLVDALIIAWASLFPTRQMLVYFVIPVGGRNLIVLTIAGTLVFAMLGSFTACIPHFIAEGLMLAYMREPAIKRWFRGLTSGGATKKKPSHLRAVDRLERDEDPPRWLH